MKRPFTVVRSAAAGRDLDRVLDHLIDAHVGFGDLAEDAQRRAERHLEAIHEAMERLGQAPFQGTLRSDLLPGIRQVTKDKAIYYFTVDEPNERINVLAIFFGGQDHQRRMLTRLLGGD
ncbi:MAG: type II toxin-antitoxin system RelE/ParE family toxin [Phyllobacteriaceae bacterium]|nr:type II toxin-antitoxin system RelE/ParE family toxin [Phyllobacteriaceae bacterium]